MLILKNLSFFIKTSSKNAFNFETYLKSYDLWNIGYLNKFLIIFFILLSFISLYYLFKIIFKDIDKKFINSIAIPVFLIPLFFYYFIPAIYVALCALNNFCLSMPNGSGAIDFSIHRFLGNPQEKYIYLKYYIFLIISILGFYGGLLAFKRTIKNRRRFFLSNLIHNLNLEELRINKNFAKGIFFTFIFVSVLFVLFKIFTIIFSGSSVNNLYYSRGFQRLYALYDFILFPPAFLIGFGTKKFKDLIYLSVVIFSKSFVMYFCLERTFESFYLGSLSFSLIFFLYQYKQNYFLDKDIFSKKRLNNIPIIIFTSSFLYLLSSKFSELMRSLKSSNTFESQSIYIPLEIYQNLSNILGSPQMIYRHFINSLQPNFDTYKIFLSQFYPLIYPKYINGFFPDNFLLDYRYLSDKLLGNNIREFGGTTFGSAFGFYSYLPSPLSGLLILIFSILNFYILYFLTNKIQQVLNQDKLDFSYRGYVFILTALPFKATWGGGVFPSTLIWYLATYYSMKIFANCLNKFLTID